MSNRHILSAILAVGASCILSPAADAAGFGIGVGVGVSFSASSSCSNNGLPPQGGFPGYGFCYPPMYAPPMYNPYLYNPYGGFPMGGYNPYQGGPPMESKSIERAPLPKELKKDKGEKKEIEPGTK